MNSTTFMLIAGEVSGDTNAAELVLALKDEAAARGIPFPPRFIGAGGPRMRAAGVDLAFDLTRHAVIGHWEVLKNVLKFKRLFNQLLKLAIQRQPEVIVLVDFSGFNLRFAAAVKHYARHRQSSFTNWHPKLVYYVSPQLWASREERVHQLARDFDLVLSIFPFEKEWYARRAPQLRVEFVGHPMVDRYRKGEEERERTADLGCSNATDQPRAVVGRVTRFAPSGAPDSNCGAHGVTRPTLQIIGRAGETPATPLILLLPGSREKEVSKHLPVMLAAAREIQSKQAVRFRIILPNHSLEQMVRQELPEGTGIEIRTGDLAVSLAEADLAIAKSGTVTLECAFFGVPAVVVYITNPLLFAIGRHVVKVKHLAMPNLLAGEEVFPELIQNAATPENIVRVALDLLKNDSRRATVREKLRKIVISLGNPGAARRAAEAIWKIAEPKQ